MLSMDNDPIITTDAASAIHCVPERKPFNFNVSGMLTEDLYLSLQEIKEEIHRRGNKKLQEDGTWK